MLSVTGRVCVSIDAFVSFFMWWRFGFDFVVFVVCCIVSPHKPVAGIAICENGALRDSMVFWPRMNNHGSVQFIRTHVYPPPLVISLSRDCMCLHLLCMLRHG